MSLQDGAERAEKKPKLRLSDEDFLAIVRAERQNAVGIEAGDGILEERERALEYFKGKMDDVPSLPNRSKVVSSDVADAVYTVLPDLVEIFTGGEELGSFRPKGDEDVEAAKQETEVVNHVIMAENDGFLLVHDAIMDALLSKVGVVYAWAEEETKSDDQPIERATAAEIMAYQQQGYEIEDISESGLNDLTGEMMYSLTISREYEEKCIKVGAVPSEDFAVARDTSKMRDTTYAVMRSRKRAQDLKALGYDPAIVDDLPAYAWSSAEQVENARDQASEHSSAVNTSEALHDLRSVLIYTHVIRVDADGDGKPEFWKVITDENEGHLLDKEQLYDVCFAVGSPYRMAHRLYGRSLADLLMEVQRIKTSLQRSALDSAQFALNQRHEVDESGATENTVSDLLNNLPGAPVRVKRSGTVTAIPSGSMGYDPFEALEYFSTVGEQRTGIVRNAQGLNPDTLHDTAKGAMALMGAAQRRTRMIARLLAETLFKDLFVIVHGLLRQHGGKQLTARIRNQYVTVDPTAWGVRKDMSIEIGMGSREQDMLLLEQVKQDMADIIQAQGGTFGDVVTAQNVYALATKRAERAGLKGVAELYSDPSQAPPKEPQPDPEMMKAQMEMEAKREEMAMKERHTQMQFQKDIELAQQQQADDMARAQIDAEDKRRAHELAAFQAQQAAMDAERKYELDQRKLDLEAAKLDLEAARISQERELKDREIQQRDKEVF